MYEIGEICFGGYLCVVSMWDIRKREIPVWLIAAGGILSASLGYFHGKIPLLLMVTGALVGPGALALFYLSDLERVPPEA